MSQHPVDRLIRELIGSGRAASESELKSIVAHIAEADFLKLKEHWIQRVAEKQWAKETTEDEYLADLRDAILDDGSRLAIYERRGGNIVGIVADTVSIVPEVRRGQDSLPLLFVVYSADRGIIVSGYQASTLGSISIPGGAQWLK